MNKIVNASVSPYHSEVINNINETAKPIMTGIAKGSYVRNDVWLGDFAYKFSKNFTTNNHTAYLSFISDRDLVMQSLSCVSDVYDNYDFVKSITHDKLSPHSMELSSIQYNSISQGVNKYDTIKFVNESGVHDQNNPNDTVQPPINLKYNSSVYQAPINYASGYLLDLSVNVDETKNYNYYLWEFNTESVDSTYSRLVFSDAYISIGEGNVYRSWDIEDYNKPRDDLRIISHKFDIDNPKYMYIAELANEWVYYHNNSEHYSDDVYKPHIGRVNAYQNSTSENVANNKELVLPTGSNYGSTYFFPEVIQDGRSEPSKIVIDWDWEGGSRRYEAGKICFSSAVHNNEPSDQSRLVYSVCSNMAYNNQIGQQNLYIGIDAETERNRRVSATVLTEPYHTTKPIMGGELVSYTFVDNNGDEINWGGNSTLFKANPQIYLKIKASKAFIIGLDNELRKKEYNTDVLDTINIKNPRASSLLNSGSYYNNFNGSEDIFYNRQNNCLEDLVNETPGETTESVSGHVNTTHRYFTANASMTTHPDKYSNSKMKAVGMGYSFGFDSNGDPEDTLSIYCTNYVPEKIPNADPAAISFIQPVEVPGILTNASDITTKSEHELLRPVIKMLGVNGYIKILKRTDHFDDIDTFDNINEAAYLVEFPYCPGSFSERVAINSDGWRLAFIYKTISYIPAGSQESDSLDRYEDNNERYKVHGTNVFTSATIFESLYVYLENTKQTNSYEYGGGLGGYENLSSNPITYPTNEIYILSDALDLVVKQSRAVGYDHLRTYQSSAPTNDKKIYFTIDNRQWGFDNNKYISYINRENPSYVYDIDATALFEDYVDYMKNHNSIPDVKRWLYAKFVGSARVDSLNKIAVGFDEHMYGDKRTNITSTDAKSGLVIEVWDNKSVIDSNIVRGNWRPITPTVSDTKKVPGRLIFENLYKEGDENDDKIIDIPGGQSLYKITLNTFNNEDKTYEPGEGFNALDLNGLENKVLYDSLTNKSYHITYSTASGAASVLGICEIYIRKNDGDVIEGFNSNNIPEDHIGNLSVRDPKLQLSKESDFSMITSYATHIADAGENIRLIDIIDSHNGSSSDVSRYVDNENKIKFRVRVSTNKDYLISNDSTDSMTMQLVGPGVALGSRKWAAYPWSNDSGTVFDVGFDHSKVNISEIVRSLSTSYFKSASI